MLTYVGIFFSRCVLCLVWKIVVHHKLVQSTMYVLSFFVISIVCQREHMYISHRVELPMGGNLLYFPTPFDRFSSDQ